MEPIATTPPVTQRPNTCMPEAAGAALAAAAMGTRGNRRLSGSKQQRLLLFFILLLAALGRVPNLIERSRGLVSTDWAPRNGTRSASALFRHTNSSNGGNSLVELGALAARIEHQLRGCPRVIAIDDERAE